MSKSSPVVMPNRAGAILPITVTYCAEQAAQVANELQAAERSYGYGFTLGKKAGYASITVFDGKGLPEPLGRNSIGEPVPFESWAESVALYFDEGLSERGKEGFKKYFLQGMTPAEALQQDRIDSGV